MSKVDALRALREARYAAAKAPAAPLRRSTQAAAPARSAAAPVQAAPEGLCGHRNMGGRSCTREADHARNGTKNHRYG